VLRASGCSSLVAHPPHPQAPPSTDLRASRVAPHVIPSVKLDPRSASAEDMLIRIAERRLHEVEEQARLELDDAPLACAQPSNVRAAEVASSSAPTWSGTCIDPHIGATAARVNMSEGCASESYRLPSFSRATPKFIKHETVLGSPGPSGLRAPPGPCALLRRISIAVY
jgi:hypothetical protein